MVCPKCKGLMVKEYDIEFSRVFYIYQHHCLNCGRFMFDPKTVSQPITKEVCYETK